LAERNAALASIETLVLRIQKRQSKVGTAIEAYDIKHLWDLGDEIGNYASTFPSEEKAIQEILGHFSSRRVHFQPALLKNAETAKRIFPTRDAYLEFARRITYGKLREVLPIFDPDFISQQNVPESEIERLRLKLREMTYEQVRTAVRNIREKYDPSGVSIDFDRLWGDMEGAITRLQEMIASKDASSIRSYRKAYDAGFIANARRLMAALSDEATFKKLVEGLPNGFGGKIDLETIGLEGQINRTVHDLALMKAASPAKRDLLKDRVGKMVIGELSTLMKAAGSDEEMQRYERSRKIIEKLRVP
jgi:hypothetical protein